MAVGSASQGALLYNWKTNTTVVEFFGYIGGIVRFLPNGRLIVASNNITVWDVNAQKSLLTIEQSCVAIEVLSKGNLACQSINSLNQINIYNLDDGSIVSTIVLTEMQYYLKELTGKDLLVATNILGYMSVWNLTSSYKKHSIAIVNVNFPEIALLPLEQIPLSNDPLIIVGSKDKIQIWNISQEENIYSSNVDIPLIWTMRLYKNDVVAVAGSGSDKILFFRINLISNSLELINTFYSSTIIIFALAFLDSSTMFVSNNASIDYFHLDYAQPINTFNIANAIYIDVYGN